MAKPSQSTRHLGAFVNVTRSSSQQSTSMKALDGSLKKATLSKKKSDREKELYSTTTDNIVRGRANESRRTEEECDDDIDCSLDQLFLVHSDISSVMRQIDELVVQATNLKTVNKHGTKEIESFRCVLSDMLTSLKPWIPRLRKAISDPPLQAENQEELSLMSSSGACLSEELLEIESPEHTKFESLISPSPLVSWRGDLNIEKGKQLFLLTPLVVGKSQFSKYQDPSKLKIERMTVDAAAKQLLDVSLETEGGVVRDERLERGLGNPVDHAVDLNESLAENVPMSSPVFRRKAQSELLMTPCLKMSPPKSCAVFDPASRSPLQEKPGACKTKHEDSRTSNSTGYQSSTSCSSHSSNLALKYPELLGIQHCQISRKTDLESSPNWSFSPPKTCIMLEPVDGKGADEIGRVNNMLAVGGFPDSRGEILPETKNTKEPKRDSSMVVENTPMCNRFESAIGKNRRAGESTLKRELWTRFEAATTNELRYTSTTFRGTSKKGFMEMLEEVSGNEEASEPVVY